MVDIFLSYTEKDRDTARRVASALESVGWHVWWDRRIPAGETWRSVLEKALENMRCMVVLWSSRSIESEWVYEEATEGRRQGKLVPVLIEAVRPPAGFREIQAADLTDWNGSADFDGLRLLVADLEGILGKPGQLAQNLPLESNTIEAQTENRDRAYDPADLEFGDTSGRHVSRRSQRTLTAAGVVLLVGVAYMAFSWREPAKTETHPVASVRSEVERPPPSTVAAPTQPPPPAPVAIPPTEAPILAATPTATSPVALSPLRTQTQPSTAKRSENTRAASRRCTDLLARMQLGETLSDDAQSVFRKECSQ